MEKELERLDARSPTESICLLTKQDISTSVGIGHFYFGLTACLFALTKIGILSILFANVRRTATESADHCAPFPVEDALHGGASRSSLKQHFDLP